MVTLHEIDVINSRTQVRLPPLLAVLCLPGLPGKAMCGISDASRTLRAGRWVCSILMQSTLCVCYVKHSLHLACSSLQEALGELNCCCTAPTQLQLHLTWMSCTDSQIKAPHRQVVREACQRHAGLLGAVRRRHGRDQVGGP